MSLTREVTCRRAVDGVVKLSTTTARPFAERIGFSHAPGVRLRLRRRSCPCSTRTLEGAMSHRVLDGSWIMAGALAGLLTASCGAKGGSAGPTMGSTQDAGPQGEGPGDGSP